MWSGGVGGRVAHYRITVIRGDNLSEGLFNQTAQGPKKRPTPDRGRARRQRLLHNGLALGVQSAGGLVDVRRPVGTTGKKDIETVVKKKL